MGGRLLQLGDESRSEDVAGWVAKHRTPAPGDGAAEAGRRLAAAASGRRSVGRRRDADWGTWGWIGCLRRHEPGDLGVRAQGVISARSAAVSVGRTGDAGGGRRTWQLGPGGRRVRAGALACGPGWQRVQRAGRGERGCRPSRVSGPRVTRDWAGAV